MIGHLCLCNDHRRVYARRIDLAGVHQPGQCFHFIRDYNGGNDHWCDRFVPPGTSYCDRHRHNPVPQRLAILPQNPPAVQPLPPPRAGIPDFRFPEPPQIVRNLGMLARDNQNVHTREVNTQTEDGIRRLCAIPISPTQDTRKVLIGAWCLLIPLGWEKIYKVYRDIEKWFATHHCRTAPPQEPDYLYYKTIRGLVAHILKVEDIEVRNELFKRAFQECRESIDLCCDGHLARLVNVMVGFDDAFLPPVSQGDLIQNRMSAINAMDVTANEKVQLANAFFTELGIDMEQRSAWLEALADL